MPAPAAAAGGAGHAHCRLAKDDSIKISIENTNTCTDSLVTALDDETLLIADCLSNSEMNYKGSGKVSFSPICSCSGRMHIIQDMFRKHLHPFDISDIIQTNMSFQCYIYPTLILMTKLLAI